MTKNGARVETPEQRLLRRLPVRAFGWTTFGAAAMVAVIGAGAAWAMLAPLHGAVVAAGVVTVQEKRRAVQHLEGGVVAEIAVRDGDRVASGDLLLKLSDARAMATLAIVEVALQKERALEARLSAERAGVEAIAFPESLVADPSAETAALLKTTRAVFEARSKTRRGAREILTQRIAQLERESEGLGAQAAAKAGQQALLDDEIAGVQQLFDSGKSTKQRLLALKRARLELEGERGELIAAIARIEKAMGETRLEILQRDLDFQSEVAQQLDAAQARSRDLEERAAAARDQRARLEIRAPVGGVVVGRAVNTLGAVARPGETLLEIVPEDEDLFLESRVRPQDIDALAPGQVARVRLSAFNQRTTPELNGAVRHISADALSDPASGALYYRVTIALPDEERARLGDLELLPGMPAEVLILTPARTAAQYMMRPITDSLQRAWREP
ncbi:MAG: HlyD family type I secretion periplasmic adaptor subunit [Pseudomonadota bacterium]